MPQQTKTFRVFVSSTFSDMKEERSILQNDVFPDLERFCEERGAKFQAVDLRWGVDEESQMNQKTLDICLNEIARCQKLSPKPNFLILLGDKYGWQPIPSTIPQVEMDDIQTVLGAEDLSLVQKWYRLDLNAVPPEYVLLPRQKEHKDYRLWKNVESQIQNVLRQAVDELDFSPEQRIKYYDSATHQEILHGALSPPEGTKKPEEHVLAMSRDLKSLSEVNADEKYVDVIDGERDVKCKEKINQLKDQLELNLGDNCMHYPATFNDGISKIDSKSQFIEKVKRFLNEIIEERLRDFGSEDEVVREANLHEDFRQTLTRFFRGRQETITKIENYINGPGKEVLSLVGKSGSGKSSVMAEAARQCKGNNPRASVIYRFIGTTSASTNIISLLTGICSQIAKAFDVTLESLMEDGREKSLYDVQLLTELLNKCLSLATDQKPLIIFLDALDQLSDTDNARALYWMPSVLPEHCRFVVSSLPELESALSRSEIQYLPVLPKREAEEILDLWFESINRSLTDEQKEEVLDGFSKNGMPIYLKLAFETAKKWHSWETNFMLKDDVKGIINHYFEMQEHEHIEGFVEHAISYMLCGRYQGLAETEILEVLAFDQDYWDVFISKTHKEHQKELIDQRKKLKDRMKIPIAVWSRLYLDLEPFLTERDADGVPIITFFHGQFNEVLRERYKLGKAVSGANDE